MSIGLPIAFAVALWWFGTGLILYVDRRVRIARRWSLVLATLVAAVAVWAVFATRHDVTVGSAFIAFAAAVAIWGWNELTFLMGLITGPRRQPCDAANPGWRRFSQATLAVLYHELALVLTLGALIAMTWGAGNIVGAATFGALWALRLSAKVNVFLGVPNFSDTMLPESVGYLRSYFRKGPINVLFPFLVTGGTLACTVLIALAFGPGTSAHEQAGYLLVGVLVGLGVIEHWFLVIPFSDTTLWRWAIGTSDRQKCDNDDGRPPPSGNEALIANPAKPTA